MKVYGASTRITVYAANTKTREVVKVTAKPGQLRKSEPLPPSVVAEAVIPLSFEVEHVPPAVQGGDFEGDDLKILDVEAENDAAFMAVAEELAREREEP